MSTSHRRDRSAAESTTGNIQIDRKSTAQRHCDVRLVRADWNARLPRWIQPFLTWLIGYPYAGQKALIPNKPWWVATLMATVTLGLGLALSFSIVTRGGYAWLGIPITWLMVICGARTFQVYICHQGVHENLTGNAAKDRIVVEVVSTVLVVQNYDGYQADHKDIHHPRLASDADVDRQFVTEVMKINPGACKEHNKKMFWQSMISPKIHALFLLARLRANYVICPSYRRMMAVASLVTIVLILLTCQKWMEFFVGCVLPMTILYHMSAMCQFVTEHFWARGRQAGQSAKDHYLSLLVNRHLGDPLPASGLRGLEWLSAWTVWWTRLFLYHVPVRLGILVGDLPVHGSHHLWPLEKRWTDPIFTFHALAEESGTSPIQCVGGYGQMLDFLLESFSEVPILESDAAKPPMTFTEAVKVANGM